jgi:hypothetical protein
MRGVDGIKTADRTPGRRHGFYPIQAPLTRLCASALLKGRLRRGEIKKPGFDAGLNLIDSAITEEPPIR